MSTYFDDASLVMIPSGYKDDKLYSIKPTSGDGDFTFSRDGSGASPATRVNASGLIEKGRENVLLQSNTFDTTWTAENVTITSGQSGYDGTNDAWLLSKAAASGNVRSGTLTTTGVQSFSVYAKANSVNWIRLRFDNSPSGDQNVWFNLTDGSVGTDQGIASYSEDVGSGWYRLVIQANTTDLNNVRIYPAEGNTDTSATSGSIYIQDAQLEQGLVATDYIETTTAAASAGILGDMPRLDYSGGATCPSLLLEGARTNLIANSEFYGSGSGWNKIQSSVTINDATSPEGVDNAAKLLASASTGNHQVESPSHSIVSGAVTGSVFAKKGSVNFVRLRFSDLTTNVRGWFDLENGEVGTIDSGAVGSIVDMGNGWYKCILTATGNTNTTSANTLQIFVQESDGQTSWTADGDEYIHIYGAQVEQGSYPTSYIPTYGSATARAGDSCSKTGISSLIGQSEGTLFFELKDTNNFTGYLGVDNGSTGTRILIYGINDQKVYTQVRNAATVIFSATSSVISGGAKAAVAFNSSGSVFYVNGVQVSTGSGTTYTNLSQVTFNHSSQIGAKIKQAVLFDERLTNAELATLTTL